MELMNISKGFERLLFDMCDKKMSVVLQVEQKIMNGQILKVENGILVFEESTDRYRKNLTYLPIHRVISVSSNFE